MPTYDYDAIVVGSGPNGLAAAITMQQAGLQVLLVEAKDEIGGGMRTAELTLPGFKHDICSAIHPTALLSPFFQTLSLDEHGLQYIIPPIAAAHPFDDGSAVTLKKSIIATADQLGSDRQLYLNLVAPIVTEWPKLVGSILGPLSVPSFPLPLMKFGVIGLPSASAIISKMKTPHASALYAGMAAHSMQPLSNYGTSAVALVLIAAGHLTGWPLAKGGSQSIANALLSKFISLGGTVQTGTYIKHLKQLPSSRTVLFDVTPAQLLEIAGYRFSSIYKWQLKKYRYGMGVFKIDWALDDAIPFTSPDCRQAGTVHIGGTYQEVASSETQAGNNQITSKPFILLAQQSLFDSTRAPLGKHTGWAYCHVPNGSTDDMTAVIEQQVERFAPGFRERILARHVMNCNDMQQYNMNYIGGDINGGSMDIRQLFTRPALRSSPYRTSTKGIYICSSSTPPGGGVHGMCGYHAARKALKDVFNIRLPR